MRGLFRQEKAHQFVLEGPKKKKKKKKSINLSLFIYSLFVTDHYGILYGRTLVIPNMFRIFLTIQDLFVIIFGQLNPNQIIKEYLELIEKDIDIGTSKRIEEVHPNNESPNSPCPPPVVFSGLFLCGLILLKFRPIYFFAT